MHVQVLGDDIAYGNDVIYGAESLATAPVAPPANPEKPGFFSSLWKGIKGNTVAVGTYLNTDSGKGIVDTMTRVIQGQYASNLPVNYPQQESNLSSYLPVLLIGGGLLVAVLVITKKK